MNSFRKLLFVSASLLATPAAFAQNADCKALSYQNLDALGCKDLQSDSGLTAPNGSNDSRIGLSPGKAPVNNELAIMPQPGADVGGSSGPVVNTPAPWKPPVVVSPAGPAQSGPVVTGTSTSTAPATTGPTTTTTTTTTGTATTVPTTIPGPGNGPTNMPAPGNGPTSAPVPTMPGNGPTNMPAPGNGPTSAPAPTDPSKAPSAPPIPIVATNPAEDVIMSELRQEDAKTGYLGAMDKDDAIRSDKRITRDQRDSEKQFNDTVTQPAGPITSPPGPKI